MSTQKLQVGRALLVIPSDECNVPFPALSAEGSNSSVNTNELIDPTTDFEAIGIRTGDIVYNTSVGTAATIVRLVSSDTIELNADIFTVVGDSYKIYAGGNNDGCVLFVGSAGDIQIETVGGDEVQFVGISGGQFIPVHVKKVFYSGTSASNIIALW
jgi:hypothetical protein